jgi:conjugative transfer signal peptidase TraF
VFNFPFKLKLAAIGMGFVAAYFCIAPLCPLLGGVRVNSSHSLRHWIFRSKPLSGEPTYGDYVSFRHPASPKILAKQVVGLQGDTVLVKNGVVRVGGAQVGAPLPIVTASGTTLTPIRTQTIPRGYVYVRGTHPESFDSRYEQCGLIPVEKIEEQLWPLL